MPSALCSYGSMRPAVSQQGFVQSFWEVPCLWQQAPLLSTEPGSLPASYLLLHCTCYGTAGSSKSHIVDLCVDTMQPVCRLSRLQHLCNSLLGCQASCLLL